MWITVVALVISIGMVIAAVEGAGSPSASTTRKSEPAKAVPERTSNGTLTFTSKAAGVPPSRTREAVTVTAVLTASFSLSSVTSAVNSIPVGRRLHSSSPIGAEAGRTTYPPSAVPVRVKLRGMVFTN